MNQLVNINPWAPNALQQQNVGVVAPGVINVALNPDDLLDANGVGQNYNAYTASTALGLDAIINSTKKLTTYLDNPKKYFEDRKKELEKARKEVHAAFRKAYDERVTNATDGNRLPPDIGTQYALSIARGVLAAKLMEIEMTYPSDFKNFLRQSIEFDFMQDLERLASGRSHQGNFFTMPGQQAPPGGQQQPPGGQQQQQQQQQQQPPQGG